MDWDNFLNTAANIIKGVGAVAGAVLEGIGEEIYRSYIQLLMNATNNEQYKWTFLTYQIGNGNFLPELPFEGRTQLFDQVYNNMQQGIISSVQDCCSMVSSSTPDLPMRCWNDTVIILCSDGNMTNDKYGYLQSLAYMLGVNSDPNYIMQYVATIMQNFDAMRSYFVWFWNYNQNKLPKDRNIMAGFVENMVQTCGLRPISQEQMKSVALSSPFINGFFSFLFGIFGLDWLAFATKVKHSLK